MIINTIITIMITTTVIMIIKMKDIPATIEEVKEEEKEVMEEQE